MVSATPLPPAGSPPTRASSKGEQSRGGRPYLPPELVLVVLERLERADLAACVRVNSGFCQLGLPILHERVHLSEFGAWPVYDDRVVPGPLNQCRPRFMQRGSLVKSTRRVDVHAHTTTRCRHHGHNSSGWAHSLPPLPRLEVLRLFLHPLWSGRRVFHTNVDPRDSEACPSTPCAALSLLHAPTLVVRGLTLVHNTVPRYEICRSLEDSVQRFVCVFEPDQLFFLPRHPIASAHMAGTHFRSRLPAYLNDLTLIFRPPERGAAWRCKSTHTLTWPLIHTYASALWAQVISWVTQRSCDAMPRRLTIVNVGALAAPEDGGCDAPCPAAETALQHRVHAEFVSAINNRTGYAEHASRVLESLSFLTMDEYIATMDEWKDVFEPEEVLTWLRGTWNAVTVAH